MHPAVCDLELIHLTVVVYSSITKLRCRVVRESGTLEQAALPTTRGTSLSHRMYSFDGFRKSTPPQNRQRMVRFYSLKQQSADLVGGVTYVYSIQCVRQEPALSEAAPRKPLNPNPQNLNPQPSTLNPAPTVPPRPKPKTLKPAKARKICNTRGSGSPEPLPSELATF